MYTAIHKRLLFFDFGLNQSDAEITNATGWTISGLKLLVQREIAVIDRSSKSRLYEGGLNWIPIEVTSNGIPATIFFSNKKCYG